MLYWLTQQFAGRIVGLHVFSYLTFRAILATASALGLSLLVGPSMIARLSRYQIGQVVRDDGPPTHLLKAGTPTMGGTLILVTTLVSTLLWAEPSNRLVWTVLGVTFAFGLIGFYDDYLKLVVRNPQGLRPRWKYLWQSVAGLATAATLYYTATEPAETTLFLPFFKTFHAPLTAFGFIVIAYLMIVGMSNAVNLTDGLDGLAIMPAALVASALGIFAYASGNAVFAHYLQIPDIRGAGELLIFCASLAGAGLGFLWFNSYPAQVFMGDVGALAIGAAIGVLAVIVRQELVALVMGGVFVLETASVILQVASYKSHRPAHFQDGADPPPLRAQGLGGAEGHRALLDHLAAARAGRARDAETAMSTKTAGSPYAVIVGLGRTGLSCARYLHARGWRLAVTDTRPAPPQLAALTALDARIPVRLGGLDTALLDDAVCVVASPGLPLDMPFFAEARRRGLQIVGDIELFARAATAPVAGITGTNGKSTVTTLLARMAQRAGLAVRVGGNLGEPALDLLTPDTELYVLELSSYQLETSMSLHCRAATVLNVSPDHLDRYDSLASYAAAKARIFARCDTAVINLDDPLVAAMPRRATRTLSFSLRASIGADYALAQHGREWWLTPPRRAPDAGGRAEDQGPAQRRQRARGARARRGTRAAAAGDARGARRLRGPAAPLAVGGARCAA